MTAVQQSQAASCVIGSPFFIFAIKILMVTFFLRRVSHSQFPYSEGCFENVQEPGSDLRRSAASVVGT
jgi:hypothetical protein